MTAACCNCGDNATHDVIFVGRSLAYCTACDDPEYHPQAA